ncbi:hypothetical protein K1T71_012485 [Dendrolimus kikuchii]|uniref:Uncharacterized protein n=1 Tax=Dendrolimus kikuchii TaxID=765133 RepID=A0ACC1CJH0_9NEOP|nr:hypothetical protein K1T71_012485 [Dendrolimus kikuchii]
MIMTSGVLHINEQYIDVRCLLIIIFIRLSLFRWYPTSPCKQDRFRMQKQDKWVEQILEFLTKQHEEDKIRQEWAKTSVHRYNPFAAHERTQKLLNGGIYNDRSVNRLPASILFNYNSDIKNVLPDYELQKFYLPLPDPPPTLSTTIYNNPNDDLGSSVIVWVAAILLMGILVLTIRAAEKCLEKRLFKKSRRASSEEWPTPSVIATSQQSTTNDLGLSLRIAPTFQPDNQDLPPPYSDCANDDTPNVDPKYLEEPPPPYAACFVAFTAPKDGVPSVQIVNDRIQKAGTSRSDDMVDAEALNVPDGSNETSVDVTINIDMVNNTQEHVV